MSLLRYGSTLLCALLAAASVAAQPVSPAPPPASPPPVQAPKPPSTEPPPPPDFTTEPEVEPQVTIIRRENETVEEVRVSGELRYIKVTPRTGKPYYLVPSGNGQTFLRSDSLDMSLKPPMWLLYSW